MGAGDEGSVQGEDGLLGLRGDGGVEGRQAAGTLLLSSPHCAALLGAHLASWSDAACCCVVQCLAV